MLSKESPKKEDFFVAIWMVTYNHEDFIKQAVESVMMQKTDFKFKLFIGEDASTDSTRDILLELKNNYSDRIDLTLNEMNLGSSANAFNIYDKCYQSTAKYVALLEGDDYWTDSLKLQKQVDFLEANPDYEVCFTNIKIVDNLNQVVKEKLFKPSLTDLFEINNLPNWAPTLTRVFKNRDFKNIPAAPGFDSVMLLWQSRFG